MDHQIDIDGIRAKIAVLEADRDRSVTADAKAGIQAEIDTWIRIHAHVLLSTRFANTEKARAALDPQSPVVTLPMSTAQNPASTIKHLFAPLGQSEAPARRYSIAVAFTLGAIVGAIALWLLLRLR